MSSEIYLQNNDLIKYPTRIKIMEEPFVGNYFLMRVSRV